MENKKIKFILKNSNKEILNFENKITIFSIIKNIINKY